MKRNNLKLEDYVPNFKEYMIMEKGKDMSDKQLVEMEVENLISEYFDKPKNIEYDSKDGLPVSIEFEITKKDFNIEYDELSMEYSQEVLNKHKFEVIINYVEKEHEDGVYKIKFDIDAKVVKPTKTSKSKKTQDEEDEDEPKNNKKHLKDDFNF